MKKETWAEEPIIRATAWLLKMDIVIHQNMPESPEKVISGNIDDDEPLNGLQLHLGYILSMHYQSLLPRKDHPKENVHDNANSNMSNEAVLESVCPVCKKACKVVLQHINN